MAAMSSCRKPSCNSQRRPAEWPAAGAVIGRGGATSFAPSACSTPAPVSAPLRSNSQGGPRRNHSGAGACPTTTPAADSKTGPSFQCAAQCRTSWGSSSQGQAPANRSNFTHSSLPRQVAECKAEWPSSPFCATSAPCANNSCSNSAWPSRAAMPRARQEARTRPSAPALAAQSCSNLAARPKRRWRSMRSRALPSSKPKASRR
mmetsp:Transcript_84430/g.187527  ORF Transcript_84430/g.187527 Transcript_84430/m.187527 type:complete len:204 (-) Transcript_84430:117-728(-)